MDLGEPGTGFRKVQFLGQHGWVVIGATDKGVVGMPGYWEHSMEGLYQTHIKIAAFEGRSGRAGYVTALFQSGNFKLQMV